MNHKEKVEQQMMEVGLAYNQLASTLTDLLKIGNKSDMPSDLFVKLSDEQMRARMMGAQIGFILELKDELSDE